MRRPNILASTIATLCLATIASAQSAVLLGPADGKDLAPTEIERVAVGAPAPDFTLATFGGGTTTLSSHRGKRNVVLVFYRGYWCPYCVKQLTAMRELLAPELRKSTELLVVSIDADNETKQTIARIGADVAALDFTFLSDPDHAVIARYGILNPNGSRRGIPHPATFVIDKSGVVRWRDVQTDYRIRPTNEAVLTAVKALPSR